MARYAPIYAGDRMIGGVFGGVLMGAGLAIIFLRGSTTGGTDIISFLVKKWYPHVPIGRMIMVDGLHYHWCICPCIRQSGICPVWSDFPVLLFYGH